MSSSPDESVDEPATHDSADLETRSETICYRCDRPIEPDCWIRLATQPGPGVRDNYDVSSQPCCPDCVAAIGLLEFAVDPRSSED